ncbi:MAG: class I SAM-dependent methyltransferase [Candidatus Obscuribacterales bacterium]|nr:class I SAM-dependent methyltransferase [Candidatus Obscuribacterales bacterium]
MSMHDEKKFKPLERFKGLADLYARFRPDYPEEAIDYIFAHCQLKSGMKLIDVGCGTGISSRIMASRGLTVVGLEPNEDMLKAAQKASTNLPITYVQGQAEATNFAAESFNAVLCAQSFHWFNPEKAFAEFHRLLKSDGSLILIWNERSDSNPFTKAYSELISQLPETKSVEMSRGTAGEPLLSCSLFKRSTKKCFLHEQQLNQEGLLGRAFSTSYVPKETTAEGQSFKQSLLALFAKYQESDSVTMLYETSVYSGFKEE